MMPFNMSMGIMTIFVSLGGIQLSESLQNGRYHECSSVTDELLWVAAPAKVDSLSMAHMGGTGNFTAVMCFCRRTVSLYEKHNITIRMPEQVPPAIARSFEVLLPVLAIFLTLYPLSLFYNPNMAC